MGYKTVKITEKVYDALYAAKDGLSFSAYLERVLAPKPPPHDVKLLELIDRVPKLNHKQLAEIVSMNMEIILAMKKDIRILKDGKNG